MTQPTQTTLQCSNCGQPNAVALRRIIDAQNDPQGKARLLSNQVNAFQCSNCGTVNNVSSPLLYHDPAKELLIAFVPMDVAMRMGQNEEKTIGDLMNELTGSLPKEQFKAYMFTPKRALTMQGLIDQILEADGVTKEMINTQRGRVDLLQKMIEAPDHEGVVAIAHEYNDEIDSDFFQTMSLMLQQLMQQGQQAIAGRMLAVQEVLIEETTYGQSLQQQAQAQEEMLQSVAEELDKLGDTPTHEKLVDIALSYQDNDDKLQALVSLARPALDYNFFMALSQRISAAPEAEHEAMEALRDTLQELIEMVDQQMRIAVQQRVQFLQALMQTDDIAGMLQANAQAIDDNFMTVLTANLEEAEKRQDLANAAKLREIYDITVRMLQSQMTPALRFLNDLMNIEDEAERQAMIAARVQDFDRDELLQTADAVTQLLNAQGQSEAVALITEIRTALEQVLN